jgi:hypothetical protein
MFWIQYKLATMRSSEFLCEQITGIPNFLNQNSNFLTFQTLERISGIKNGIGIPLPMGVPGIETKKWNTQGKG